MHANTANINPSLDLDENKTPSIHLHTISRVHAMNMTKHLVSTAEVDIVWKISNCKSVATMPRSFSLR